MARRVCATSLALSLVCACGCGAPATMASQEGTPSAARTMGADCGARVLCDEVLVKLIAHSIAICEREAGPSGTDQGREWAFWHVRHDLEGIQGLLDATYAARALENPFFVHKDLQLQRIIVAGIHECERQIRSDAPAEHRREALIGMRGLIVAVQDLLKAYYTAAGLQWPDDRKNDRARECPAGS